MLPYFLRHSPTSRVTCYVSLLTFLFLASTAIQPATGQERQRTELLYFESATEETTERLRSWDIEIISWVRNNLFVIATEAESQMLAERGFEFEHVTSSDAELQLYKRAMYGEDMVLSDVYNTYDQILDVVDALIAERPNLIAKRVIGQTQQGNRDIYAVKVSDRVDERLDRPAVLFTGAIHSRELATPEINLALIRYLVDKYESDGRARNWMRDLEIYFIPVINVDGHYIVTHNLDPRWRKNARDATTDWQSVEYPKGVDLNRNYDFNFAFGGADEPESIRYRGPHPFSESEVRAVRDFVEEIRPVLSINYHSQGEVIFYPWVWNGLNAPDDALLTDIAQNIADQIVKMDGSGTYDIAYGAGTVGQSYPWLYGRYGTFDFIVETGRGAHVFPPEEVAGIVEANLPGAFYLLDRARGPGLTGHVTDAVTGDPLHATVWFPEIENEMVDRRLTIPEFGRYYRPLAPGTYTIVVMKDGYQTQRFSDVEVNDGRWTELNIQLQPKR